MRPSWRLYAAVLSLGLLGLSASASAETSPAKPAYSDDAKELQRQADAGKAEAQYWLAQAYIKGTLGQRDEAQAMVWMERAAKQNYGEACLRMGRWRVLGIQGLPGDEGALEYFMRGARAGHTACQMEAAALLEQSDDPEVAKRARPLLEQASEKSPQALLFKGAWLMEGRGGYARDQEAALRIYLKVAQDGNFDAASVLAAAYSGGRAVKQDFERGEQWLRRAAYGGNPDDLAILSLALSAHPAMERRKSREALLLAQEADAAVGTAPRALIRFALACAFYNGGKTKEALAQLQRVRYAQARQPDMSLPALDECEAAWKAQQTWSYPAFKDEGGRLTLAEDRILQEAYFKRMSLPETEAPGLSDPVPKFASKPEFSGPHWYDYDAVLEELKEQVDLPSLVPQNEAVLKPYQQEGKELMERARKGELDAAFQLAWRMLTYRDKTEIQKEGFTMMERVAGFGHPAALNTLGQLHQLGWMTAKNEVKAFKLFQQAANAGDVNAMFETGRCFDVGLGTEADAMAAASYLRRAVVYQHPGAQDLWATKLLDGRGVERDVLTAAELLFLAAGKGFPESQYRLAMMHKTGGIIAKDEADAVFWAERAAKQDNERAQYLLGMQRLAGLGCKQDSALGAKSILASAQQYFLPAMRKMGDLYRTGVAVPQDKARAEAWLRRAARQGNALDQARLAEFLAIDKPGNQTAGSKEIGDLIEKAYAGTPKIEDASKVLFYLALARTLAAQERWNDALDMERNCWSFISMKVQPNTPEYFQQKEDSLKRQDDLMAGKRPEPLGTKPDKGARQLIEDTILQESEDNKKPKPAKGPSWDVPWNFEV